MPNEHVRKYRIGISGSYGGMNLGDEAILKCIIDQWRKALPVDITVFSRNPKYTMTHQRADRAVPVRELSRDEILPAIQGLDVFLLGGGGILFDGDVKNYLREVQLALDKNVPVMVYAIGAGPLKDPASHEVVRKVLNRVDLITVRERNAKRILEEAGVDKDIIVTADPALLLQPEPFDTHALHREGLEENDRLIGISVREPGVAAPDLNEASYHALLANAADYMVDRFNADIVFVPMERKTFDLQHSHAVIAQMLRPERASVLKGDYSPGQILTLMRSFVFAVGMRLHFLMFAALQNVPFVALPYASKVHGFLEDLKLEVPPLHLVNPGRLIAHIDHSWDNRDYLVGSIQNSMPALKQRSQKTLELAVELLRSRRPQPV